MKFNFKKVVEPLDLGKYHEAYKDMSIDVWVNPLPEDVTHLAKVVSESATDDEYKKACEQLVNIWSQSEDASRHWTVEELQDRIKEGKQRDPMLMLWLVVNTMTMISEYRTQLKKNSLNQ